MIIMPGFCFRVHVCPTRTFECRRLMLLEVSQAEASVCSSVQGQNQMLLCSDSCNPIGSINNAIHTLEA